MSNNALHSTSWVARPGQCPGIHKYIVQPTGPLLDSVLASACSNVLLRQQQLSPNGMVPVSPASTTGGLPRMDVTGKTCITSSLSSVS